MPEMNPRALKPYSVQWRPDMVTGWVLLLRFDSHDDARAEAEESLKKWDGQSRVVTQHVVEVFGLWTGAEAA